MPKLAAFPKAFMRALVAGSTPLLAAAAARAAWVYPLSAAMYAAESALRDWLALTWRSRLTSAAHAGYTRGERYYTLQAGGGRRGG